MFYEIIDVPHPHQRFLYLFYTFLIYVLFFVPHRGTSNNSIKCELLSMSGPRLRCGVISVKMLAFLNLISCEYGASGKPQTADAQRSPRKLKSLWQWQEYQFTHGDCARGKVPLTFNYSAVWVHNSKNTCEGKYCKISLESLKESEREGERRESDKERLVSDGKILCIHFELLKLNENIFFYIIHILKTL